MFRNPSHSSISIYLPDTLTCSTHSRTRLPRGRGGGYWGEGYREQPLLIDKTSLFACTSAVWLLWIRLRSLVFSPYFAVGRKRLFKRNVFSGPGEGSFDCLEQWGSLAALAAANLMSITVKFLMKQYAKYANQRPPLTRLLLLVVDLIAFCHIQRGSCSCSRLALVKVPAHKAKGADGLSRLPSRAGT